MSEPWQERLNDAREARLRYDTAFAEARGGSMTYERIIEDGVIDVERLRKAIATHPVTWPRDVLVALVEIAEAALEYTQVAPFPVYFDAPSEAAGRRLEAALAVLAREAKPDASQAAPLREDT